MEQSDFEDGEGNPLTNTVFVIKYDFTLGDVETKNLTFTNSQLSSVVTPEYTNKVAADAAYAQDPTEENRIAKENADAAYVAIGSIQYYAWQSINLEAGHALHLYGRAFRLNDSKSGIVPTENGIIFAENNMTVYVGCIVGTFGYRYDKYITVPSNCMLDFEGGSINSGTIAGNNTGITAINDNIFDESIILAGTFTGNAYADWVKTATDDAAIQINKLDTVFKAVHFKSKEYHIKTQCSVNYNLIGDSIDSVLIVHTPIAMEYQPLYGKIENITFKGYNNGGTCFLRCNDKNFYNCKFQYFDVLFNTNVYIGRTSLNGCRIEYIGALNVDNALVNGLIFNDCFINHCSGWFTKASNYTNLSFNNCNIQETNLISPDIVDGVICFNNVTFSNNYIETTTFDFRTLESSGSIYFFGCHFYLPRIINTGQNTGQSAALANLLITFDSCEIQIPDISTDLVQFNINNYIMIKIIGPCTIGTEEYGAIRPVDNIESIINNPDKLWYETTKGISGNWTASIKYGDKNVDGTLVSKVKIVDKVFNTQAEVNAIFDSANTIYKLVADGWLYGNVTINMPANCTIDFQGGCIHAFNTGVGYFNGNNTTLITNGKNWVEVFDNIIIGGSFTDHGNSRPAHPFIGQQYFEMVGGVNKPIWYDGNQTTGWVDATGNQV